MSLVECSTQEELEAAVSAGDVAVVRSGRFRAFDSASVRAFGSASVRASDSASVSASDSASVRASGSASVRASGSASVSASGSASVRASDSASVRAFGSASVRAFGSASVRAFDSASVSASDSASVRAFDSASVSATPAVAVHNHGTSGEITGGVVIPIRRPATTAEWCAFYGVDVADDGTAVLYKAVDDTFHSGWGTRYAPGDTPEAPDWNDRNECGGGLHLSPRPFMALTYNPGADRFVACTVNVADLVVISDSWTWDKAKAPRVLACVEVDEDGAPIAEEVAS